jgi:hypothetical protein
MTSVGACVCIQPWSRPQTGSASRFSRRATRGATDARDAATGQAATGLTVAVVLVVVATHEGWNVWLVGDSGRWAAVTVTVLGLLTCALGSPGPDRASRLLAALGVLAGVLAVAAILTGSLTALSFLVLDVVALWALATARHAAELLAANHDDSVGARP